jgi:hypothetical protein
MTTNHTARRRFTAATLLVASGAVALGALGAAAPASASPDNSTVVTSTTNTPIAKTVKQGKGLPGPSGVNPPVRLHCSTDKDGNTQCWVE